MSREFTFKATLTFGFATQTEMTSMRTKAQAFATANNGTAHISTNEQPGNDPEYFGRLVLDLPVTSRANAATLMGTIDSALDDLPDLVSANGYKLKYDFEEFEI